jgi:hypothetical protein
VSTPLTGASNASGHAYQPGPVADDSDRVTVFVINAVQTSGGPGPGVKALPAAEASALVARRYARYGDQPPLGWPG